MIEIGKDRTDLASFCQLIQELISGSVRRHTFSQNELELLFDLQMCKLRRSSKPEALRKYLRAVHQQAALNSTPLRFSVFLERENALKAASQHAIGVEPIPQTAA